MRHPRGRAGWWKSPCPDLVGAGGGLPPLATRPQPLSRSPPPQCPASRFSRLSIVSSTMRVSDALAGSWRRDSQPPTRKRRPLRISRAQRSCAPYGAHGGSSCSVSQDCQSYLVKHKIATAEDCHSDAGGRGEADGSRHRKNPAPPGRQVRVARCREAALSRCRVVALSRCRVVALSRLR